MEGLPWPLRACAAGQRFWGLAVADVHAWEFCPSVGKTHAHGQQVATILGTLLGRFSVALSPRMGGYAGLLERQTIAFTLAVDGGLWLSFQSRPGWAP